MRIGIFGGSFNPIHTGHIALAQQLKELAALDEVWLMVSPQNPLKQGNSELLDDRLRYQMARLALHGVTGIVASDYELHLPKPSYTWNTLQRLHTDFPQHTFSLLIGGDNWERFPQWYNSEKLIAAYNIVVYPRRDSNICRSTLPANVSIFDTELYDISSTEIRQRVKLGQSIRGMVVPAIEPLVRRLYLNFS